ncbi:MFS transporter [Aliikangiella sp. IMCC44632]
MVSEKIYQALVVEDEGRLCKDIPESACNDQPKHFLIHVNSLSLSKLADGFIDPKLILSWLLAQLGASSTLIGLLVPIREAGALLPQLLIAEWVRRQSKRKLVWALGCFVQAVAALGIFLSVLLLANDSAAIVVLVCLCILAIARSFCSVSYKDILGKTLAKSTRGTATGLASSLAAVGVLLFAVLLGSGLIDLRVNAIVVIIAFAGCLWLLAGLNLLRLNEKVGSKEGGENGIADLTKRIKLAFSDGQFILFVCIRGLLTAAALAPPFLILLGQQRASNSLDFATNITSNTNQLGLLLIASATASLLSSYVWGKLADHSSRRVLCIAGVLAGLSLASLSFISIYFPSLLAHPITLPCALLFLMIAYQGVRLGRSVHLVDMGTPQNRAHYTAVSNTFIGLLLLVGSVFGWLAQTLGVTAVISLFAIMCVVAGCLALKLDEVQDKN